MKKIIMAAAATVLASGMAFAQTGADTVPGTGPPATGMSPTSPSGAARSTTGGSTSDQEAPVPPSQGTNTGGSSSGGSHGTGGGTGSGSGAGTGNGSTK